MSGGLATKAAFRRRAAALALLGAVALHAPAEGWAAAQIIAPAATELTLEVNKGRLVRLDRPASSIFVADPKIADVTVKSPTLVYVIGKSPGETTLFAVDDHDRMLLNMGVAVQHDAAQLQRALRQLVPESNVAISTVDNTLVLSGTVATAAEGEDVREIAARFVPDQKQLINKMQVEGSNQVNLRVRVAEVSRDVIKAFGFDWQGAGRPGSFLFGLSTLGATGGAVLTGIAPPLSGILSPPTSGVPLSGLPGPPGFIPGNPLVPFATGAGGVNNLTGSFLSNRFDLNTLIDALDSEGLVSVLAEPNLTALSGEPASFLAGGEFPIPVPQALGVISVTYMNFGVSLNFVATILSDNRISLKVKPEVSELSNNGAIVIQGTSVPSLTTRRAETTVELASGQSFAIAGLLQNDITQNIQKFPWLADLPILGQLFRSERFERNQSELVIIVTPYVVRPVSSKRLLAPTDGYVPPSDGDMVLKGADYVQQPRPGKAMPVGRAGAGLIGPVGFDLQ